jgi:hypothetical protein
MPEMLCREVGEISCRNEQRQARKSQTVFAIRELTGRQLYLGECFKVVVIDLPLVSRAEADTTSGGLLSARAI